MPVTSPNGIVSGSSVTFARIIVGPKVYLYLDYTKGTEDSVTLSFKVKEDKFPDKDYTLRDGSFNPVRLTLTANDRSVYTIEVPVCAEDLVVEVTFTNVVKTGTLSFNADGVTTTFSGTLLLYPQPTTVTVSYVLGGVSYTVTDDGAGNISDANLTGTVDYNTGALSLTFSTAPDAGTTVDVAYSYANEGVVDLWANIDSVRA